MSVNVLVCKTSNASRQVVHMSERIVVNDSRLFCTFNAGNFNALKVFSKQFHSNSNLKIRSSHAPKITEPKSNQIG